jgi:hypothetical protein
MCSGCCDSLVPPRIESSSYGMVNCAEAIHLCLDFVFQTHNKNSLNEFVGGY